MRRPFGLEEHRKKLHSAKKLHIHFKREFSDLLGCSLHHQRIKIEGKYIFITWSGLRKKNNEELLHFM